MPTQKPELLVPVDSVVRTIFKDRSALVWRLEWVDSRWSKVPYRCDKPHLRADGTKPTPWSIGEALDIYDIHSQFNNPFDGVGVPICDGLVMHDEDHKYDPDTGFIEPAAYFRIKMLDSFTELSPSGAGIHVFAYGQLPPGRRRGAWEMYSSGRYSTVTGRACPGFDRQTIERRQAELHYLALELMQEDNRGKERITDADARMPFALPTQAGGGSRHDTIWRHMRSLKAKGVTFDEALEDCLSVNERVCAPSLDRDTVIQYVTRVWHVADRPGFRRPPNTDVFTDDGWS